MSELLVRRGIDINYALETLGSLVTKGETIARGGGTFGPLFNDYLSWMEQLESHLRHIFRSEAIWRDVYSDRYWRIREMGDGRPVRPIPLISGEASAQVERLQTVASGLRRAQQEFDLSQEAIIAIPDSNVLVHYRRYNELDWCSVVGSKDVRLVLPLIVIDELDDLKSRGRPVSDRAAGVLRAMQKDRGEAAPEMRIDVREGVTMQILVDPPGHERRTNNDDELLTRAEYISAFVGERVTLVSGDYGMRLRAAARGLRYVEPPEDNRLSATD